MACRGEAHGIGLCFSVESVRTRRQLLSSDAVERDPPESTPHSVGLRFGIGSVEFVCQIRSPEWTAFLQLVPTSGAFTLPQSVHG